MTPVSHTLDSLAEGRSKGVLVRKESGARTFDAQVQPIAQRLVAARLDGEPLADFPGPLPPDLDAAYAVQDAAIALWPDVIGGWKVGLIAPALARTFGHDRLAGPIFRRAIRHAVAGQRTRFPVFRGGFAAVEAEFLLRLGRDAHARKTDWTRAEAADLVDAVHVGVETAGSPLAAINDLGPPVIAADFGNNAGLIVGPELPGWRTTPVEQWRCESFVDGAVAGRGHGGAAPGGPFESLRFLLELCARRSRPLQAGDWVSTGAVTGVHEIEAGQSARISFAGAADILCIAEPFAAAKPKPADGEMRC